MYFHGGVGSDVLWFRAWQPTSIWATAGICLAVCALAGFERWLMSLRRILEYDWAHPVCVNVFPVVSPKCVGEAWDDETDSV